MVDVISYLSSLLISVLRSCDTEANKFYDISDRLDDATLLTGCYTQHTLRPVGWLVVLGLTAL